MLNKFLWCMFLGLLITIIVLSLLCFYLTIYKRHKALKTNDEEWCKKYDQLPIPVMDMYITLLERRYSSIQNFYIFQISNKVFGFTGVLFSVISFGIALIDIQKELAMSVSLVSIICVVIALYLSPTKRVMEYINAWRKYDKLVSDMISVLPKYNKRNADDPEVVGFLLNIGANISKIEADITSDGE